MPECFVAKAGDLEKNGAAKLTALKAADSKAYELLHRGVTHLILGLGGEDDDDTLARIKAHEEKNGPITDAQLVEALAAVLLTGAVLLWPRDDSRPRPQPVPVLL